MKPILTLLSLILFSGCYTQVQFIERRDDSAYLRPRTPYNDYYQKEDENTTQFDENGQQVDGNEYEQGYADGYDNGFSAFIDWNTANRMNNYYSRFYWTDPYWGASFYDPFLWDPYWGVYAGWGISYYDWNWRNRSTIWRWNNGWVSPYWGWYDPVVVIYHDNHYSGNSRRWSYGPRTFGNEVDSPVRISNTNQPRNSVYPGNTTSGSSRNSSTGKITVPSRPSRNSGSTSSSKPRSSSSGSSKSSSSKSGGSSSKGSSGSRPSRTGNNSAQLIHNDVPPKAIVIPTGYGSGLASSQGRQIASQSPSTNNTNSSVASSKPDKNTGNASSYSSNKANSSSSSSSGPRTQNSSTNSSSKTSSSRSSRSRN